MIHESRFDRESLATESASKCPSDPHLRFVHFIVMFGKFEKDTGFEATDVATKEIGQRWTSIFNVLGQ